MICDDVVMVFDLCVRDGATSLGVVWDLWVVRRKTATKSVGSSDTSNVVASVYLHVGGSTNNWADGGHVCDGSLDLTVRRYCDLML